MQSRDGPTPARAAAPIRLSAETSSPSSSSSGESLPTQTIILQQQLRQPLPPQEQQQQLRNAQVDYPLLYHQSSEANGIMDWGTQLPRNFVDLPSSQLNEENQNNGQFLGQTVQNPLLQAYFQFPLQSVQQKTEGNLQIQQEPTSNIVGPSRMDQDMHPNNMKMQDLVSLNSKSQSQMPTFITRIDHPAYAGKHTEQEHANNYHARPPLAMGGQLESGNIVGTAQFLHSQASMQNNGNNQSSMAQIQTLRAGSNDHTGDSIAQVPLLWQLNRMAAMQKQNEPITTIQQSVFPSSREVIGSPLVCNESIMPGNSIIDYLGRSGLQKPVSPACSSGSSRRDTSIVYSNELQMQQQKNNAIQRNIVISQTVSKQVMHLAQSCASENQDMEYYNTKHGLNGDQMVQMQQIRPLQPLSRAILQPSSSSSDALGSYIPYQSRYIQPPQKHIGFTKQQHFVFRAQMLAFRRFIRNDYTLPHEILQAVIGATAESQTCQPISRPGVVKQERFAIKNAEVHSRQTEHNSQSNQLDPLSKGHFSTNMEFFSAVHKDSMVNQMQCPMGSDHAPAFIGPNGKSRESNSKHKEERGNHEKPEKGDFFIDKGKNIPEFHTTLGAVQVNKLPQSNFTEPPKDGGIRKYNGPIFDFPSFARKYEPMILASSNHSNNLTLAIDVKDLLTEEVKATHSKKRAKNLEKINGLLTVNLERKNISPDIVLNLQIEEKKLRLADFQSRVRVEVEQQQQEIMAMNDRSYRKFARQCRQHRLELSRQVHHSKNASIERQLKPIIQWRKTLLELNCTIRDARAVRNRGVAKYHERMLREFSKKKNDNRNRRMEALKNNDVDRYRKILLEQQTDVPGDAAQRYFVLSSFLTQTEEYLHKLGRKVVAAKNHQEVQEAANVAADAARTEGLSEQEVKTAAASAGEEVMIRNRFSEMNSQRNDPPDNKYYNLAHAVTEKVVRHPSLLRAGTLRDYQIVGLQWMLSLYNNKLNGILADEMGLGKTVQVMALIAYLMEFKENYGPHLIIVPNAVLVNWKSELALWLPSVECIFYVGTKERRSKLFLQEVYAHKFNVLITTYEFVMHDRSKLSKIDWNYIIIDEAQRMKDRESVLARDLDRYRCQRRLLLTGTPLQNDLKELWSLLNLLLPEVFDNQKVFQDWFSKPFQRDGRNTQEDEWLETEKKVIIIHRLHQILEPFMLRRRVEEVEGSLPRKVSIVLKCRMSPIQSAIYEWIKSTGTIKVDPEEEMHRVRKNPLYQAKLYKNLNNKCMELRKVCNHPLLNYPYFGPYSKDFMVRSCGKLWILDRVLMKLKKAGHRVLLFSTMTKLLDILEEYLEWRQLVYRRIDGTTTLEDRETAIMDFNSPKSDCFIFLLSIRAAGRGLNLQSADTVVIYDPDSNPQNEEQAVARAHRIGQTKEVKVIYMEAVVEKISSHQKEDKMEDMENYPAADQYMGSIESLIRNNIQQYKIEMADEVINAGRFDQMTTHEERRLTLETLLHDEERYQEMVHDVPSMQEVNRMIARSDEEVMLFDQMDGELDLTMEMLTRDEVPMWLRASFVELEAFRSKKSSRNIISGSLELNKEGLFSKGPPCRTEKRRGRPKGSSAARGYPTYRKSQCELAEGSDDSEDRTEYDDEEGEFKDEELNVVDYVLPKKDQLENGRNICDNEGNDAYQAMEIRGNVNLIDEAVSPASSSRSRILQQSATSSTSLRKIGSLGALEVRTHQLKKMSNEPAEGGVASACDHDGYQDQFLQPKLKRKRSTRTRPRYNVERIEERPTQGRLFGHYGFWQSLQVANNFCSQLKSKELELIVEAGSGRHDMNAPLKQIDNLRSRKKLPNQRSGSLGQMSGCREDTKEYSMNSRSKAISNDSNNIATEMSNVIKSRCKKVINKLQMIIKRDGHQNFPNLSDWWLGCNSFGDSINSDLSLQLIEKRLDGLEYNGVVEFISDVQSMLKNIVQHCYHSYEVKYEAGKFQDIFFDILKPAFPDIDFREVKKAMTFTSPGAANVSSPFLSSTGQCKQHAADNQVEMISGSSKSVSSEVKLDDRQSTPCASKCEQESRSAGASATSKVTEYPHPTNHGNIKRKRKERGKFSMKPRISSLSSLNPGRADAPSPADHGTPSSMPCSSPDQQAEAMLSSGLNVQWAKRAKRTRNHKRPNDVC